MKKFSTADCRLLGTLSELACCNPFTPERIALEQRILGDDFVADDGIAWSRNLERRANDRPNVIRISELAGQLVARLHDVAASTQSLPQGIAEHYVDVLDYVLLYRHIVPLNADDFFDNRVVGRVWKKFCSDYTMMVAVPGLENGEVHSAAHLFACLCQVHRAFTNIYEFILGDALPSVSLRAAVWESVFTADLRRYRRSLYQRMNRLPTLITGPTGTGKELVARAIGLSQYVPFDEGRGCFEATNASTFFAINLSAMSATLIESELFGHRKGAFTGAIANRQGWLEQCGPQGAIFLDEIGELDPVLQVKLLRVVQQRTYSRLGESEERQFDGKIIGATNRDMDEEIEAGRFREDLYYRLCADRVHTPGLRELLDGRPEDLRSLCLYIARGLADDDADTLCDQAVDWIQANLGGDYPWRGNIRELEQCLSSIMIRGRYLPSTSHRQPDAVRMPAWLRSIQQGEVTAEELMQKYCTWIYHRTGSYEATARLLKIDRRTVRSKIDEELLEELCLSRVSSR